MEGNHGALYSFVILLLSDILKVMSLESFGTGNNDKIYAMYIGWMRIHWCSVCVVYYSLVWFMVFNATVKNISVILWRSVLLMEETGLPAINHRPASSH